METYERIRIKNFQRGQSHLTRGGWITSPKILRLIAASCEAFEAAISGIWLVYDSIFSEVMDFAQNPSLALESRTGQTPTDLLLANLRACSQDKDPVVLITTGSFNPVHRAHIEMQHVAQQFINGLPNKKVIACYMSPSNDDYVTGKFARSSRLKYFLDFQNRCQLMEAAIEAAGDSAWMFCDRVSIHC